MTAAHPQPATLIPGIYEGKVEEVRQHLGKAFPAFGLEIAWDAKAGSAEFRFLEGGAVKHRLQLAADVLEDFTAKGIIHQLEEAQWRKTLSDLAPGQAAVFTSTGFRLTPSP